MQRRIIFGVDNKKQIAATETDIKGAQAEVKKAEDEVQQNTELLGKRVRVMYKSGNYGYLSMIMESKDISDFLSRIEWINRIVKFDKKMNGTPINICLKDNGVLDGTKPKSATIYKISEDPEQFKLGGACFPKKQFNWAEPVIIEENYIYH